MKELEKVYILGTVYTIYTTVEESEKPAMKEADGITDFTTKEIFIAKFDYDDPMSLQKLEHYEKRAIRHEIVHAVLFESGLDGNSKWARDEEIVDWIAIQFPKLLDVFKKIGAESF